jgi:hypothetical protein
MSAELKESTLYKALLVSIGADWTQLSISSGKGVEKSAEYISGWKKICISVITELHLIPSTLLVSSFQEQVHMETVTSFF